MLPALLLVLAAQQPAELDAHLRNVHLERRLTFDAAWDGAADDRRQLVRDLFAERRRTGVPAAYQVSAQFLTEAAAVLRGEADDPRALSWERRFACSLDLLVLPGAFGAGEGGRGDEVIVRVLPVTTRTFAPLPEQVLLRLVWVGPAGQEIPARAEPVHRSAFQLPGFEMYLRAPASRPGRWHLVPEVELEGRTGRGQPVPVDCVLDLFGRFDRLAAHPPADAHEAAARAALARGLTQGLRDALVPPLGDLLDGARLRPLYALADDWAGRETVGLRAGVTDPSEIVLVVAPALEQADWVFAGGALDAWRSFATARGARVVATALPVADPRGPDVLGLLAGLRAARPDARLTLALRGPAVGRLAIALSGDAGPPPFDRIVVDTVLSASARPRRQYAVPTLLITPLFEQHPLERVPGEGPPLHWLRLPDPPLVVERDLPAHLAAWLDELEQSAR